MNIHYKCHINNAFLRGIPSSKHNKPESEAFLNLN